MSASAATVIVAAVQAPGAEIVHVHTAAVVSVLPAASVARTRNWCGPAARLV